MRKPLIAGNWKMYKTPSAARAMLESLLPLLGEKFADGQVMAAICGSFTNLCVMSKVLVQNKSSLALGAQNLYWEQEGAFTGEISGEMLVDLGVKYVIVGHSERREYFAETDEIVNKKANAACNSGLIPIVCVGESQETREKGEAKAWVKSQILGSMDFWQGEQEVVVAYEPIWAIGTGLTATPKDAGDMVTFIRQTLAEKWGAAAANVQILYGGSVKPGNIKELMQQNDIDGALVGGASLEPESFAALVNFAD